MNRLQTDLEAVPPFDFQLTAGYRTRFKEDLGTEAFRDNVYRRVCDVRGRPALLSLTATGTAQRPRLRMEVVGDGLTPEDFASLRRQSNWLLGLDYDLAGFYATVKEDPVLDGLVCRLHGLKPTREPSIFQSLVTTVIGQQISSHVAYSMLRELVQSYGEPFAWEEHIYYRFPTPEGLASRGIEGLRRHKLSQRKSEYIYGIALAVAEGTLDLEGLRQMGNEGVIRELTQLRGVGTWTAQWILCNPLGRFDVFPSGDLALLRMLSRLYLDGRAVTPEEAEAFSERWGPYRVPVITYLYAALRLGIDIAK